ncbi:acyl-CoA dehydrogenase family protein [Bacillus sp. MUM 13]|uniref:acyl-CoA dehydrogenase family protein n=1 Tax=Bacillus sp. MUM 13 TaxID=1678001 RepID=UPI0008F5863B|nr:acyl-CoA dehydrogenase family protein [Bacillus sp. MUM 13]OIK05662.1 acyl-CoA dehydrogenase [Bacillus sp. MUM 13]
MISTQIDKIVLGQIIKEHLKPFIQEVDEVGLYPKRFLNILGENGFFHSTSLPKGSLRYREIDLIQETANHCMTTAFTEWCHLAALTALRLSSNPFIKNDLLPALELGEILGGTGLSNALKYYAGLENIRLKAERTAGGYFLTGSLPSVSNLDDDHWFVIVASQNEEKRIIGILPLNTKGLISEKKTHFIGLKGSGTYSCSFDKVFIPDDWIISQNADTFIQTLRPFLVLYQIPLGIGVSHAAIQSLKDIYSRNSQGNRSLKPKIQELSGELESLRNKTYSHAESTDLSSIWKDILQTRLEMAKLTLKATQTDMLFSGGQSYIQGNDTFRRLREAYFLVNLSPTIKQLMDLFSKEVE